MRKKFTNDCPRKTTVRKLKKGIAKVVISSEHIANVTGHRGINFLNDYDEADEEEHDDSCSRPNEIMKTPALRKSKYYYRKSSIKPPLSNKPPPPQISPHLSNKLPLFRVGKLISPVTVKKTTCRLTLIKL